MSHLLQEDGLLLERLPDTLLSGIPCYEFIDRSTGRQFLVDKIDGSIRSAFLGGLEERGQSIEASAAVSLASAYASRNGLVRPPGAPRVLSLGDSSTAFKTYIVEWQLVESGVRLPEALRIGVNARSGRIVSFDTYDAGRPESLKPSITEEEAEALALPSIDFEVDETDVALVSEMSSGLPVLAWCVEVQGSRSVDDDLRVTCAATVLVDAESGRVISVERF